VFLDAFHTWSVENCVPDLDASLWILVQPATLQDDEHRILEVHLNRDLRPQREFDDLSPLLLDLTGLNKQTLSMFNAVALYPARRDTESGVTTRSVLDCHVAAYLLAT